MEAAAPGVEAWARGVEGLDRSWKRGGSSLDPAKRMWKCFGSVVEAVERVVEALWKRRGSVVEAVEWVVEALWKRRGGAMEALWK